MKEVPNSTGHDAQVCANDCGNEVTDQHRIWITEEGVSISKTKRVCSFMCMKELKKKINAK